MVFPDKFLQHLQSCPGFSEQEFIDAHREIIPVSIRLNQNKTFTHSFQNKVPWSTNGYYLETRPQFVFDPLFHAGAYYVQEASGMFVEYLMRNATDLGKSLKILDLCAAPGGKSTILASLISEESLLVSNEIIKTRVSALKENVTKWGNSNIVVTNNDPNDFNSFPDFFDVILVDAPCSGSGLFRKDIAAMNSWSMENVLHCTKRQKRILHDIIPSLQLNGILIYTTCSYSKEENEDIVQHLVEVYGMEIMHSDVPQEWNIISTAQGYRFYPDKIKGEGFFACVLKKIVDSPHSDVSTSNNYDPYTEIETELINNLLPHLVQSKDHYFFNFRESIYCCKKNHYQLIKNLTSKLRVLQSGIEIGKLIRNELIPSHAFAMSNLVNDTFPGIALELDQSIQFLKKESFQINNTITGWTLCTYQNIQLGWIKIMPGRINNYYPVEWRIRK